MIQSAIKGLLDESGLGYKQNSKSYILTCPRCRKREKLYIRKGDGRFCCWVCKESDGFQGKPEYVFRELTDKSISELRSILYGESLEKYGDFYLDIEITDFFDEEEAEDLPVEVEASPELFPSHDFLPLTSPYSLNGLKYLESRGIPLETALEYDIQYWPSESRIIFPIKSKGKWYGWQARYVNETSWYDEELALPVSVPKVLTSFGTKKDRLLMFSDRINSDYVVLCEGPMDALKASKCGANVATMGKAISKYQIELLKNAGIKRIYLGLDPDAFMEAQKLVKTIVDVDFYDLRPPSPYKDLGEMSMDGVYELFKNAPKIDRNFLFLYLKDHYEH